MVDAFQTGREGYVAESVAIRERIRVNVLGAFGDIGYMEAWAVAERIHVDDVDMPFPRYVLNGAAVECERFYHFHGAWDDDEVKSGAVLESPFPDAFNAFGDVHDCGHGPVGEGIVPDFGDVLRDGRRGASGHELAGV